LYQGSKILISFRVLCRRFTALAEALLEMARRDLKDDAGALAHKFKHALNAEETESPSEDNALHMACVAPCCTPLARQRQAVLVRYILACVPAAIGWGNADGALPLHHAAMAPNDEAVKALLDIGDSELTAPCYQFADYLFRVLDGQLLKTSNKGWNIFHWCIDPRSDVEAPEECTLDQAQQVSVRVLDAVLAGLN
jgi:hypothetical protein